MVQKDKQLQSIYNLMHGLEQAPTGVRQKQANLCIAGTNFILIKTIFVAIYEIQKSKTKTFSTKL